MHIVAACLALVACGGSRSLPRVAVIAESGDAPEPGANVVSHTADGAVIDQETPDATGVARVEVEPGALITVVFPSTPQQIVTTLAPAAGAEIVVHGPTPVIPQTGVGALGIMPTMSLDAAGGFDIALGCVTIHVPTLPTTVDLNGACLGSDLFLDVLIRGYDASQQLVGYAAGHVMLEGDVAEFDPATWLTTGTPVPIALTGVAPTLAWTLFADGLAFDPQPIANPALLWTGLAVDSALVVATIGDQITTLAIAGPPTAIALGTTDFLPPVTPALGRSDKTFTWTAADVGADLVDLRVTWTNAVWDAVLPPDAASATFPALDLAPPSSVTSSVTYIDSSDLPDFPTLDEIFAEQTATAGAIVALPVDGEIRTSSGSASSN